MKVRGRQKSWKREGGREEEGEGEGEGGRRREQIKIERTRRLMANQKKKAGCRWQRRSQELPERREGRGNRDGAAGQMKVKGRWTKISEGEGKRREQIKIGTTRKLMATEIINRLLLAEAKTRESQKGGKKEGIAKE
jgi:hypothetical protein